LCDGYVQSKSNINANKLIRRKLKRNTKFLMVHFNDMHLLTLNAKPSVATSLALNLQMSLTDVNFLQKNGATKQSDNG